MFNFDPDSIFMMSGWSLYAVIFLLPFIQEDAAVIGAATASLAGAGPSWLIFLVILAGLSASDIWKYWLGWAARRYQWAHKLAERPGVSVAGDLVRDELVKTLFAARFVPGTRIPTYIACGFFRTFYLRFVFWVVATATLYVTITFTLFHWVGEVAGEQAKYWLPAIALTLIVGYLAMRYISHRNSRLGPMTPLSNAPDHDIDEAAAGELHADSQDKPADGSQSGAGPGVTTAPPVAPAKSGKSSK